MSKPRSENSAVTWRVVPSSCRGASRIGELFFGIRFSLHCFVLKLIWFSPLQGTKSFTSSWNDSWSHGRWMTLEVLQSSACTQSHQTCRRNNIRQVNNKHHGKQGPYRGPLGTPEEIGRQSELAYSNDNTLIILLILPSAFDSISSPCSSLEGSQRHHNYITCAVI